MKKPLALHKNVDTLGDVLTIANHYLMIDKNIKVFLEVKSSLTEEITGFSGVASWRGSYSEPTVITGTSHDIAEFVEELNRLLDEEFSGYKGDTYTFDVSDSLHIEYCESSTGYGVMFTHAIRDEENNSLTFIADKEW